MTTLFPREIFREQTLKRNQNDTREIFREQTLKRNQNDTREIFPGTNIKGKPK